MEAETWGKSHHWWNQGKEKVWERRGTNKTPPHVTKSWWSFLSVWPNLFLVPWTFLYESQWSPSIGWTSFSGFLTLEAKSTATHATKTQKTGKMPKRMSTWHKGHFLDWLKILCIFSLAWSTFCLVVLFVIWILLSLDAPWGQEFCVLLSWSKLLDLYAPCDIAVKEVGQTGGGIRTTCVLGLCTGPNTPSSSAEITGFLKRSRE